MLAIILRDGKRIGLAEHDASGLGVLTWFHNNVHSSSADHALKREGYSVQNVEDIDCRDVESFIGDICNRAGVTMEAAFVPFSQSRNAKPGKDGKAWLSLNWRVTIKRHGRDILTTDYAQGMGHAPCAKLKFAPQPSARVTNRLRRFAEEREAETGRAQRLMADRETMYAGKLIDPPSIGDVMQSLARDSDVLDSACFEDWAAEFGYDTDSREAERTYRACLEIATKLRAGLGAGVLAELRLAASFN